MRIGFVGLGAMGSRMAARLLHAGHEITLWNRSPEAAESFAAQGAVVARSPAAAARHAEVVFSMVTDDEAVAAVVLGPDGIAAGLGRGAIHASSSTISIALAQRMAAAHGERGQVLLSTTVLGRPSAAEAGTLFIIAAGPDTAIASIGPVLDAIGQRVFVVGAEPWQANLVKLCANLVIHSTIEQLGEVFALGAKGGVPDDVMFDVLTNSLFTAPVHVDYGKLIVECRFSATGVPMTIGRKDNESVLEAGSTLGVAMPFASLLRDRFIAAVVRGDGALDVAALSQAARRDAALPLPASVAD